MSIHIITPPSIETPSIESRKIVNEKIKAILKENQANREKQRHQKYVDTMSKFSECMQKSSNQILLKDIWHKIFKLLSIKDILRLRQTSKYINYIIINHDTFWYKQYKMHLAQTNRPEESNCCTKVHGDSYSDQCLTPTQKAMYKERYPKWFARPGLGYYNQWSEFIKQMIREGKDIDLSNCMCSVWYGHYTWEPPASIDDIKIDKDYHTRNSHCIFWYLKDRYESYSEKRALTYKKHYERLKVSKRRKRVYERRVIKHTYLVESSIKSAEKKQLKMEKYESKIKRHKQMKEEDRDGDWAYTQMYKNFYFDGSASSSENVD